MFQNYLIESNIKLRKSCADLFKATFEVPFDPNSISLLEKLVLIFTKLEVRKIFFNPQIIDFNLHYFIGFF